MAGSSDRIAFILKGYPRLSESFVAQEIAALEERGLDIVIVSLRRPTDRFRHPAHDRIRAKVHYLPEYLWREPARLWRAWRAVRRWPGWKTTLVVWWRDFKRQPTPNRARRLGQALILAAELGPSVRRWHAHFIHTPGSVARYASVLTGLPWTASAHARDIWTIPDWEKTEKLRDCQWLATCTAVNAAHLAALGPSTKIETIYHGLDFSRFSPPTAAASRRDGGDIGDPVVILSVGRAVAKKGLADLLAALARLPADLAWRFEHIGGGPLAKNLRRRAAALGLADRVNWLGPQPQAEVLRHLRAADIFVLASRVAADGDRDGLPNVLLEAQSQSLACIASDLSAIPELIEHGRTGVLVAPGDAAALALAIARLAGDPDLRHRLGQAGSRNLRAHFDMNQGMDRLAARFGVDR